MLHSVPIACVYFTRYSPLAHQLGAFYCECPLSMSIPSCGRADADADAAVAYESYDAVTQIPVLRLFPQKTESAVASSASVQSTIRIERRTSEGEGGREGHGQCSAFSETQKRK